MTLSSRSLNGRESPLSILTKIQAFLDDGSGTEKMPVWYCDDDMRGLSAKVWTELQKREETAKQKTKEGG